MGNTFSYKYPCTRMYYNPKYSGTCDWPTPNTNFICDQCMNDITNQLNLCHVCNELGENGPFFNTNDVPNFWGPHLFRSCPCRQNNIHSNGCSACIDEEENVCRFHLYIRKR